MGKCYNLILLILIVLPVDLFSQNEESWKASAEIIEKYSRTRPEFNVSEEKVPSYNLPELLLTEDGHRVKAPRDWEKVRRKEILELFREHVYGRVPSTPFEITFQIKNNDKNAINGDATLRQVDIIIASGGKSLMIPLTIFVPNKVPKPVPVYLLINNRGARVPNLTDPTREVKSEWWPVEEIIARGYAAAVFNHDDVDPDDRNSDFKNGIHGILDRGERKGDSWGAISAWAWGASRCMDYLITDKDIDKKRVALVGHSRGGKTALWAGAEDERFAAIISNDSGEGGSSLIRRRFGETPSGSYFYCINYRKYIVPNDYSIPVDAHMLIALIAPRAVYIASASEDLQADPKGSYLALYHAIPVYHLLKCTDSLSETIPPLNKQIISGKVGHHIRDGGHDLLLKDWKWFLDFGDVVLK